ncbi:Low-Density Lipoprotein Receptor-Related Protein 1B [Manis pentadactyla]|nr:Low-Density Lipoprotein Receptor-Related Protein 1B [Manis pentadactyla]
MTPILWVSEVRRTMAVQLPTESCGAGGDRKMTAIEGGVVSHRLILSISVSVRAGACAALCFVWDRREVVCAFPEGSGVPIRSEADLQGNRKTMASGGVVVSIGLSRASEPAIGLVLVLQKAWSFD